VGSIDTKDRAAAVLFRPKASRSVDVVGLSVEMCIVRDTDTVNVITSQSSCFSLQPSLFLSRGESIDGRGGALSPGAAGGVGAVGAVEHGIVY
jgi:hypothetical protein